MIKVLVVDDSALMRKVFRQILSSEVDMELAFARSGKEALAQLHAFAPDVVTLDINMPDMDGLACLDRIMVERPSPVLIVSSISTHDAQVTLDALRLGAVDFCTKPDGAISLRLADFALQLVAKVRQAAKVKLKASLRLRERVQHRFRSAQVTGGASPLRAVATRGGDAGVVVIGASTGGPQALETLLTALPASFGWPIVIAQHMPASFTGALAQRLDDLCDVRVLEVQRGVALAPGHAYIGKGDRDVIISRLGATPSVTSTPAGDYPWRPSADRLARSAMAVFRPDQIVGVLLTGMGNDGAAAMADLKKGGGSTIAESEESAIVWGMPGELVRAGGASWILPLRSIAEKLLQLVPHAADPPRA